MTAKTTGLAIAAAAVAVAVSAISEPPRRPKIPDRVDVDPKSKHFWSDYRKIGVRIDGEDRPGDVLAFCVSGGWADIKARNPDTRKFLVGPDATFVRERITGKIEPYYKADPTRYVPPPKNDDLHIQKAAEKRARKAEKRRKQMGV